MNSRSLLPALPKFPTLKSALPKTPTLTSGLPTNKITAGIGSFGARFGAAARKGVK